MKVNQSERLKIARCDSATYKISYKNIKEMVREAEELEMPDDAEFEVYTTNRKTTTYGDIIYIQIISREVTKVDENA